MTSRKNTQAFKPQRSATQFFQMVMYYCLTAAGLVSLQPFRTF